MLQLKQWNKFQLMLQIVQNCIGYFHVTYVALLISNLKPNRFPALAVMAYDGFAFFLSLDSVEKRSKWQLCLILFPVDPLL